MVNSQIDFESSYSCLQLHVARISRVNVGGENSHISAHITSWGNINLLKSAETQHVTQVGVEKSRTDGWVSIEAWAMSNMFLNTSGRRNNKDTVYDS